MMINHENQLKTLEFSRAWPAVMFGFGVESFYMTGFPGMESGVNRPFFLVNMNVIAIWYYLCCVEMTCSLWTITVKKTIFKIHVPQHAWILTVRNCELPQFQTVIVLSTCSASIHISICPPRDDRCRSARVCSYNQPAVAVIWRFPKSWGTPKSSIYRWDFHGFSIINYWFWGTPIYGKRHI